MVGFAVTSFFVSFAWMDIAYLMAALITGLYVSTRAQLAEAANGSAGRPLQMVSPGRVAGWRVRQSAWRFGS
jgi:hypothetical protein